MKKQSIHLIVIGVVLCGLAVVQAAPADDDASGQETWHLADLLKEAYQNNPDIQTARSRWLQTAEGYPAETALDDPMVNFMFGIEHVETRVGPQDFTVGISQTFPFPGTLRQKGKVVKKEIEISELMYETTVRDVISELKKQVFELNYIDQAVETTRQNQQLLQQILDFARAGYANQAYGFNDVTRAETQLAQLDYDLVTLRELRIVQAATINAILNKPADSVVLPVVAAIPPSATPDFQALEPYIEERNQEIQIAQVSIDKSVESISLAKKQNLPSFTIGSTFISTGEAMDPRTPDSGKDPIMFEVGVNIPLWFQKNRARVRIAEEGRVSAESELQSARNRVKVDLRKIVFKLENARRLMALYRDRLLPEARHAVEIAQQDAREHGRSVTEVLESQSVWLNFNLAFLRARADYAQSWVELERLAGGSLYPMVQEY